MSNSPSKDQLLQYIERVERLEEEKRGISSDIKDVYAEIKANGYTPKIIKKIVNLRRKSKEERQEEEALLDLYMQSIDMQ